MKRAGCRDAVPARCVWGYGGIVPHRRRSGFLTRAGDERAVSGDDVVSLRIERRQPVQVEYALARNARYFSTAGIFCTTSICGLDSVIPAARNCFRISNSRSLFVELAIRGLDT